MEEREWSDMVMTVNGQPLRVLPEVDFGGEEQEASTFDGVRLISLPLRTTQKAMELLAKEISKTNLAFARLMAGFYRWAPRYRFHSRVERRHSRTRRKRRPTRLQRRRQRQTTNRVKR